MKKLAFLTLSIIILFSAQQVSAVSEKANGKATDNPSSEKRNENSIKQESVDDETDLEVEEPEDENEGEDEWKNHGQYVSSVAKTHPGGSAVSEAAKSDIGKKDHDEDEGEEEEPSITPSGTITPSPTDDPDATPSPTLTETPTPTPDEDNSSSEQMNALIQVLENIINTLKGIFNI